MCEARSPRGIGKAGDVRGKRRDGFKAPSPSAWSPRKSDPGCTPDPGRPPTTTRSWTSHPTPPRSDRGSSTYATRSITTARYSATSTRPRPRGMVRSHREHRDVGQAVGDAEDRLEPRVHPVPVESRLQSLLVARVHALLPRRQRRQLGQGRGHRGTSTGLLLPAHPARRGRGAASVGRNSSSPRKPRTRAGSCAHSPMSVSSWATPGPGPSVTAVRSPGACHGCPRSTSCPKARPGNTASMRERVAEPDPSVVDMRATLTDLRGQFETVQAVRPRREQALREIEQRAVLLRERLRGIEGALRVIAEQRCEQSGCWGSPRPRPDARQDQRLPGPGRHHERQRASRPVAVGHRHRPANWSAASKNSSTPRPSTTGSVTSAER